MKPTSIKPTILIIMSLLITAALWAWVLTTPAPKITNEPPYVNPLPPVELPVNCWYVIGIGQNIDIGHMNGTDSREVRYAARLRCYSCGMDVYVWDEILEIEYREYKSKMKKRQKIKRCDDTRSFAYEN